MRFSGIHLALFVPCVLYLAITVYWIANSTNRITGDEPHYLMLTESLLRDGDVWVGNNYEQESPVTRAMGASWAEVGVRGHVRNGFSLHHPALAFLLFVPYAAAGVAGAQLFLAGFIGLLMPWLAYFCALPIIESRTWAVASALVFTTSLPFLAGANQLYTDLVGGILILYAALLLVNGFRRQRFSLSAQFGLALVSALLPWLHIRFLAPSIVLTLFLVWICLRNAGRHSTTQRLAPLATTALSYGLLGMYHYVAFQNPFGPFGANSLSFDIRQFAMIFLGLHWDSFQGMFLQNPFLLFGLMGVVPFAQENPRGAFAVTLLYLSVIVPNALHFNWYGGVSFAGRYAWAAIGLWIFLLGYAVRFLLQRRWGEIIVLGASGMNVVLQILLAREWVPNNVLLYNRELGLPQWAQTDLYTNLFALPLSLHARLPAFRNFDEYLYSPANYAWIGFGLLLVLLGTFASAQNKWRMLWRILGGLGVGLCIVLFLLPPPHSPHTIVWTGAQVSGSTGQIRGEARSGQKGKAGILASSPPLPLYLDGRYRFTFDYSTGGRSAGRYWIALDGGAKIAKTERLRKSNRAKKIFSQIEDVPSMTGYKTIQLWIYYNGRGELEVTRMMVELIPTATR